MVLGNTQGSVSGMELFKPAQEPILRIREHSAAKYISSTRRRIVGVGFVDDVQHYGAGARHLPTIVKELGTGSSH